MGSPLSLSRNPVYGLCVGRVSGARYAEQDTHAPLHGTRLLFLPPGMLLLRGIIPELLCWCRRCAIVIKRSLSVGLPVCVYLLHQFLRVMPGSHGYLYLHPFFRVGIGLDVRAVYKSCLGGEISCLRHFFQDPTEYLVYCLRSKSVLEIVTHHCWTFSTA